MKSKGILYNADMVRAWFAGKKTMTRRPLRTQPRLLTDTGGIRIFEWETRDEINRVIYTPEVATKILMPYCPYSIGMELWGREAYQLRNGSPIYRADGEHLSDIGKWTPSIHMFQEHSRIHQIITNIRVEMVRDISEEDAIAEGVWTACPDMMASGVRKNHIGSYRNLWQSLYGDKYPWEATWVFVLEYPKWGGEELLDKEMEESRE